ncbi:MAG: putative ribonuclease inhibitor RraA/dimethylmenaquinone methyltransferase [Paenibacillus sp.]|nr:putative ribonuclease inhibitor RraA/dimethylmenaquinone methyltransferase [Paenibacillus sp.]
MNKQLTKAEWIDAYKQVPTGNIADAMDILGLPRGIVQGLAPLSMSQPRMVGFAYTIKQMPRHQESEARVLTKHADVIDQLASSGDIIVFDVGGRLDICTGGAILALRAQVRGINGFIIDGCFRDVQEIVELGFPVHLRGVSPLKSSPDLETVGTNIPVMIGGIQVKPGDFIVADDTGIVVIPFASAGQVLDLSLQINRKEEKLIESLRAGMSINDALKQMDPS